MVSYSRFRPGMSRLDPYRVDWLDPDGTVSKGAAIAVPVVKLSVAEQDAFFAREDAARGPAAPPQAAAARAFAREQLPPVIPPHQAQGLVAASDGRLLLRRFETKDFPAPRYDVVDRRSQLVGVLALDKGERIVGFGPKSVYVAWKDADDIERLRRHPWP